MTSFCRANQSSSRQYKRRMHVLATRSKGDLNRPVIKMRNDADATFAAAFAALSPSGVLIGFRRIAEGDEDALLADEAVPLASSVVKLRRQSGAARIVARKLLASLGAPGAALPRSGSGAPAWPPGIIGSLAHDDEMAVAAVMRSGPIRSLGIDIEPAIALPAEIVQMVTTPGERATYGNSILESRLLFCIKEAVFKASHPVSGVFLDFHHIEVSLETRSARVCTGHVARISFMSAPRVVALACL